MLNLTPKNRLTILCSIFFSLWSVASYSQDPCGCEEIETLKICYLSIEDYCDPGHFSFNCEYSLDGAFMAPGIVAKLLNPFNFGSQFGSASCGIELKKLPLLTAVEDIEDCECNVVFVGQFPVSVPPLGDVDLSETYVPEETLEIIKDWSVLCDRNLVIATQAEANPWGYITENQNINPNFSVPDVSISIFDGPFGSLNSFLQGGSFQGVFTQIPPTGAEILALDAVGRPTIVLDEATNDIILADVGILCSGNAGQITEDLDVLNNNDILACNLFALGCQLAEGLVFEDIAVAICEGDSTQLPDGTFVLAEGIYLDTLQTAEGCDSIVQIQVSFTTLDTTIVNTTICPGDSTQLPDGSFVQEEGVYFDTVAIAEECLSIVQTTVSLASTDTTLLAPALCEGDNFSITLNGNTYDVNNPAGLELLTSVIGCDSFVQIQLEYAPHSYETISFTACSGDGFSIDVNDVAYNEANPAGQEVLINQFGCDSIVTVNLNFEPVDTTLRSFDLCEGEQITIDGQVYDAGSTSVLSYPVNGLCDSIVIIAVQARPLPEVNTDSLLVFTQGSLNVLDFDIPEHYAIQWMPASAFDCSRCPTPTLLPGSYPPVIELTVVDTNNCSSSYAMSAAYICNPYIPNAFSPNGDGRNDLFQVYNTCPIEGFQIEIYNRWGGLVYQSDDIQSGWDGRQNGQAAAAGVYVYAVTIQENGEEKTISGEVLLVR
jgi:gliding motility-associated-like protein